MSNWQIDIEDAALLWQPISTGQIESCSSGTASESQLIPDVAITFAADLDLPTGLLDPETNRDRPRLRITDGSNVRYFRIETLSGSQQKALDYPSITGRAWAGIITDWPAATVDWVQDISASDMARQICTRHISSLSGDAVSVVWLAANDPTIPGGRYQVSRRERWELLKELAEMCGALVRVSLDGMGFEIYDRPDKALTGTATRTFTEAQSLSYELLRVKQPGNAIRIRGEQADYTRPRLPVVVTTVYPTSINANGTDTATATAKVYDSAGQLVQHSAVIDQSISAGSYTSIPVSGCFSVEAVWLNTGTYESPTKGSRVTPSSFTASAITVPDNANQLFIVSYTQAESVSFNLADQADEILGEAQTTTGALAVSTTNAIGRVIGVYRSTDSNRSGVNFYTGGSATPNTTSITLGITPGHPASVIIDYETYNGTPLSASISPASALCDATGTATATIGAGSTVGTAKITASALGQEGSCWLSLLGAAVDSMTLTSDKAQILAGSSIAGQIRVAQPGLTIVSETIENGGVGLVGYVVVPSAVSGSVLLANTLSNVRVSNYRTVSGEHRIYLKITNGLGEYQYFTFGTSTVDVSYNTSEEISNSAGTATITATVLQSNDSPASDGTPVDFALTGLNDCSLSSTRAYTTGGVATTDLSAGSTRGRATVTAICGSQRASLSVEVVRVITDDTGVGTVSYPTGTATYPGSGGDSDTTDSSDRPADSTNGTSICGSRRLVGCEGEALAGKWVTYGTAPVVTTQTDNDGWFNFCVSAAGSYTATVSVDSVDETFTFTVADPA